MNSVNLGQIAALLGCPPPAGASGSAVITGVASLTDAGPTEISFISSDAYATEFAATRAGAVMMGRKVKSRGGRESEGPAILEVDDAESALSKVLEMFAPPVPRPAVGVDASARVAGDAVIAAEAAIGAFVFIGQRSRIGRGTVIHPGVYIGDEVAIGENCEIFPNVTIRERITIGNRVIIHANSALGTDGFGYRWDGAAHAKVPQIGTVEVEDDVEIGSCVCIDRAKFAVTRVGRGTKIDNLVQVGHNVVIGPHCIVTGQVGLAGSVTLGTGVALGGQSAVRDHVKVGDQAAVVGCSAVAEDVEPRLVVSGSPALPHRQNLREQAALRRLPDLMVQVRKLQERIEKLEK